MRGRGTLVREGRSSKMQVVQGYESTQSVHDEVSNNRHGAFGRIGDHGVPAIRKSFELHEMCGERRRNVGLAFYRQHRIVLASEYKGRALDAAEIRKHVECVAFTARSCEPMQHL